MWQEINQFRIYWADILSTKLLSSVMVELDLWHVIHFISGILIFLIIIKILKKRNTFAKFVVLFILIFMYEIFEWTFYRDSVNIFKPESLQNSSLDIILGLLGGYVALKFKENLQKFFGKWIR